MVQRRGLLITYPSDLRNYEAVAAVRPRNLAIPSLEHYEHFSLQRSASARLQFFR
jgi:hypothetical protein